MRTLEECYAACAETTRVNSKSFFFALSFLPEVKRRSAFAIYDFCRHVDDLVDERGHRSEADVREDLAKLATMVEGLHGDLPPEDARWSALHDTVRRYQMPVEPMLELIEGVALDLTPILMRDTAALLHYCYLVAGVVGLMLCSALGAGDLEAREPAIAMGIGMQLTNILRDVAEDLKRDRIYLPATELASSGLSRADLERGEVTAAWRDFMRFQVQRARDYYQEGDRVIDRFPNDGSRLAMRLCQRIYAGILDVIEQRDYDVFSTRAVVSTPAKLGILLKTLVTEGITYRIPQAPVRLW